MNVNLFKNVIVIHKTFGKGTVKVIDDKYVEIEFTTGKKVRKFLYPSMFAAGKKANELGHPVVLDPVGGGASLLRTETTS